MDEDEPPAQVQAGNVNETLEEVNATGEVEEGTGLPMFAEGVVSGVLQILGAATALAMAGLSLWQLIDDVKNHGTVTQEIFDSLMFATTCLTAICLTASLFFSATWIPIAGALLAIAGIIIGLIASKVEKPPNPVDDWMVDYGIPFVNGLPPQTPPPPPPPQIPSVAAARLEIVMA
jgi:hypothetical protein